MRVGCSKGLKAVGLLRSWPDVALVGTGTKEVFVVT